MVTKDDNELVFEALHGSKSSFEALIERYQKKIYGMILQMTGDSEMAKDLTQDVFVKVWVNLVKFNFKYRFFSWLYRIALNETMNSLKNLKRFESLDKAVNLAAGDTVQPDKGLETIRLNQAVRNLKTSQRSLILLKYYFGLSCLEIAEVMEISEKKVKDRLFNARLALRDALKDNRFFDHD